jgi:hypothetical protein
MPLDKKQPLLGSWISSREKGGVFGAGCLPCNAYGSGCAWGNFRSWTTGSLQQCHITRHARCESHRKAVARALGQPESEAALPGCPPKADFEVAWRETRECRALNKQSSVGGAEKQVRMRYCMAEALRSSL